MYFPIGYIPNNRYRGPAESNKFDTMNTYLYKNISNLYSIFDALIGDYNILIQNINSFNNVDKQNVIERIKG